MVSLHSFVLFLTLLTASQAVLPPSIDPFYRPPPGFETTSPGSILRSRPITAANFRLIPIFVEATQLLYRTRSVNGSAIASVTTIFKPFNAQPNRFVSFQVAEDSAWVDCAPSYNFEFLSIPTNAVVDFELLLIEAYLASGYTVSAPDYEGPDATFSAGRSEGYSVLDSMRAAEQFLGGDQAIVGSGYSGGAIATGWAASLQHTYAPELDIKGWAMGGTPANLTGTLVFLDDTLFSGFLPAAINGLNKPSSYQQSLAPVMSEIMTPYGQSRLDAASANCATTDLLTFAGQSVMSYKFQSLGPGLMYHPVIASVLTQHTMGINSSETPTAPVYLYHASMDEVIPYANASTLFNSWCSEGVKVHFATFESGGHLTTEIFALVPVLQFIGSAFAQTTPTACSTNMVLNPALDPFALGLEVEPILIGLMNTAIKLGSNDANLFNNIATSGHIA